MRVNQRWFFVRQVAFYVRYLLFQLPADETTGRAQSFFKTIWPASIVLLMTMMRLYCQMQVQDVRFLYVASTSSGRSDTTFATFTTRSALIKQLNDGRHTLGFGIMMLSVLFRLPRSRTPS